MNIEITHRESHFDVFNIELEPWEVEALLENVFSNEYHSAVGKEFETKLRDKLEEVKQAC